jgi:redox-sensitive bicupin YhaK (pirin superfamily)
LIGALVAPAGRFKMKNIRKSSDRGDAQHGWLQSMHTFSFADYYDEKFMGFGAMRVLNEDRIAGGKGFAPHSHKDMEILSYVISGSLTHEDSMGNKTVIRPGEVQRMSAGSGVRHSEMNGEAANETHFLQIWIMPEEKGIAPSYEQKSFEDAYGCSDLILVASRNGRAGSLSLNQDAEIYAAHAVDDGEKVHKTYPQRKVWIQVIKGEVSVDGDALTAGDGAGLTQVETIKLQWKKNSEFLVLDLPS